MAAAAGVIAVICTAAGVRKATTTVMPHPYYGGYGYGPSVNLYFGGHRHGHRHHRHHRHHW